MERIGELRRDLKIFRNIVEGKGRPADEELGVSPDIQARLNEPLKKLLQTSSASEVNMIAEFVNPVLLKSPEIKAYMVPANLEPLHEMWIEAHDIQFFSDENNAINLKYQLDGKRKQALALLAQQMGSTDSDREKFASTELTSIKKRLIRKNIGKDVTVVGSSVDRLFSGMRRELNKPKMTPEEIAQLEFEEEQKAKQKKARRELLKDNQTNTKRDPKQIRSETIDKELRSFLTECSTFQSSLVDKREKSQPSVLNEKSTFNDYDLRSIHSVVKESNLSGKQMYIARKKHNLSLRLDPIDGVEISRERSGVFSTLMSQDMPVQTPAYNTLMTHPEDSHRDRSQNLPRLLKNRASARIDGRMARFMRNRQIDYTVESTKSTTQQNSSAFSLPKVEQSNLDTKDIFQTASSNVFKWSSDSVQNLKDDEGSVDLLADMRANYFANIQQGCPERNQKYSRSFMISLLTGKQKSYVELPQFEKVKKVLHPYVPTTQSLRNKFTRFDEEAEKLAIEKLQKATEQQNTSRTSSVKAKSKSKPIRSVIKSNRTDNQGIPSVSKFQVGSEQKGSTSIDSPTHHKRQRLSKVIETNPSTARGPSTKMFGEEKTSEIRSRLKHSSLETDRKSGDSAGKVTFQLQPNRISPPLRNKKDLQVVLRDESGEFSPTQTRRVRDPRLKSRLADFTDDSEAIEAQKSSLSRALTLGSNNPKSIDVVMKRLQKIVALKAEVDELREVKEKRFQAAVDTYQKDRNYFKQSLQGVMHTLLEHKDFANMRRRIRRQVETNRTALFRTPEAIKGKNLFEAFVRLYKQFVQVIQDKVRTLVLQLLEYHRIILFEGGTITEDDFKSTKKFCKDNQAWGHISNAEKKFFDELFGAYQNYINSDALSHYATAQMQISETRAVSPPKSTFQNKKIIFSNADPTIDN